MSVAAGASFTLVTLIVIVLADWSVLTPPLAVPPSSWTWNVKLASAAPLAWSAGVNTSRPALMLATETDWPAVSATPLLVSVPDAALGIEVITTAANALAGLSFGSLKPNSKIGRASCRERLEVMVLSVPAGASFTLVTLIVIVLADWSVLTPPLAVPPSSWTWNVKLASAAPLAWSAGVNTSRPALMLATETDWPADSATPLLVSVPDAALGIEVITTAANALAGLSFGSLKPNSKIGRASCRERLEVMVLSVPAGASFTLVTLIVIVLADWSVLTPPLAVPPSSWTWNVKLASAAPLAWSAGVNTSRPALMLATETDWPADSATPLLVSVPDAALGIEVITTAANALAGLSFGSLKPNSKIGRASCRERLEVMVLSVPAGASFTLVTLIVIVLADWSVLTPPLAVPPSSWTWNVKLASAAPLAWSAGVNTSRPALMLATETDWPADSATPLLVSVPDAALGIEVITTAANALAGLSFGSLKPNSKIGRASCRERLEVMVLSVPAGASFTLVTLIVIVLADWSVLTPPLAVPPSSWTWNVKLASAAPLAWSAGVNTSRPALMLATETDWPADSATPLLVSVPDAALGIEVITTAANALAGLSFGSLKPNSKIGRASCRERLEVMVLSVPAGASFTLVTLIVIVLADWSVLTPPLAVPPSSWTWNVKLASAAPLAWSAGVNTSRPALMLATETDWPAVSATPLLVSVPDAALGIEVITTAANALAGLSFGSLKPNSSAVKAWAVFSLVVMVLSVPAGASFTLVTLIVIVLADWSVLTPPLAVPPSSWTWNVKLASAAPLAWSAGVNTSRPALMLATETDWPAVSATPLLVSVPDAALGIEVITTAANALAGLSFGSLKPNSSAVKAWAVFSLVVM